MDQASAEYEIWDVRYEEEEKEPTNKPASQLTEWEFLSRVWGQSEAEDCHGGDEKTRHDQIIEIIHRPPSDLDGEGDVQVGLGTTLIDHLISLCRNTWSGQCWEGGVRYNVRSNLPITSHSPFWMKVLISPPSSESNFKSSWKYFSERKKMISFNWSFRSVDERNSQREAINKSWRFFWYQSLSLW